MAMKGNSAPEVGETLSRARALAEKVDRPEYLWPVFLGQSSFHRVRGEHHLALGLAQQLEKSARRGTMSRRSWWGGLQTGGRASSSASSLTLAHSWNVVMALLTPPIVAADRHQTPTP
jgi:hypothetical protein